MQADSVLFLLTISFYLLGVEQVWIFLAALSLLLVVVLIPLLRLACLILNSLVVSFHRSLAAR